MERNDGYLFRRGPEITQAGQRFHVENPNNDLQFGLDKELYIYLGKALFN
jgi:hypothetical protein